MRPAILNPLYAPIATLQGVGPKLGRLIERAAGPNIVDLIWHLPTGIIDRRFAPTVAAAPEGDIVTLTLRVDEHCAPRNPRLPYKVRCSDQTGEIDLVFFRVHGDYVEKALPVGRVRVVSGRVERYGDTLQMPHPDHIVPLEEAATLPTIEPVYGLTEGLSLKVMAKAVRGALSRAPDLPEWHDPALLAREGWPSWHAAVLTLHRPETMEALALETPARRRLAYDELLANQLALALMRARVRRARGRSLTGDSKLRALVTNALPYELTGAQKAAIKEIESDLAQPHRMLRLLQGDVGSGKTVVALFTMLIAVEAGAQAALMAPTEILARQHMKTLEPFAAAAGFRLVSVLGRERGRGRAEALARLAAGEADVAIGTHALIEDEVAFRDLALVVIDEQHRFGVHQRLMLGAKGSAVDVLVMTATPIPRTLTLTAYGDMDISRLHERPPGRKPIDTRVLPLDRLNEIVAHAKQAIAQGARIYWVCPLVEESELIDLAAAAERHAALRQTFGERVGLVHGRMKSAEKDATMAAFAAGALDILVATTVIEVGIDVPEAIIIIVEHAERFGLAQLHQLRGRVGRGARQSHCVLLYAEPLGETARARLIIMRETDDGFRIAEEDLRLRGAGELLGTRQSGLPAFRLANLMAHGELLGIARDDARLVLDRDPLLTGQRGEALRLLLYLFERDAAVRLIASG
ncbi:MAG: ATP-dependent DNA helicase RecG [Alphaproteobacteria bacterium]|nr:ATP-dependent DNA helicase RecG [Alphaproteobacteria bacterium]